MNSGIATSPSVWNGIVVIPSSKAYEPSKELEQIEDPKEDETINIEINESVKDERSAVEEPKMELN